MARTETMTVRLSPETRWALEILSRIENQSVTATAQTAIENHIASKIEELKKSKAASAQLLENAQKKLAVAPYSRVLALSETCGDLMNVIEGRTLALLEELGVISPRDDAPGFDFEPILLRLVWDRFAETAERADLDVRDMVELKNYVSETREDLGIIP